MGQEQIIILIFSSVVLGFVGTGGGQPEITLADKDSDHRAVFSLGPTIRRICYSRKKAARRVACSIRIHRLDFSVVLLLAWYVLK